METNLKKDSHGSVVTVTVTGFHVEVGGGAAAELAGGAHGLNLGGSGALRVEVSLAGDIAGGGGDYAAEVGMGGGDAGGFVGDEGGASDVSGVERVVARVNGSFAFADEGRREVRDWSETQHCIVHDTRMLAACKWVLSRDCLDIFFLKLFLSFKKLLKKNMFHLL